MVAIESATDSHALRDSARFCEPDHLRRYAALDRMLNRMRPLWLSMVLPLVQHQRKKNAPVQVFGLTLQTHFEVHHPGYFFSSRWLAKYVLPRSLNNKRFLDMGTGSGLVGLVAARNGARVLAVDHHSLAVQLAEINARRNNLAARMQCRISDLFSSIAPEEQFDVMAFDLPPGSVSGGSSSCLLTRFLVGARKHLHPGGSIIMILAARRQAWEYCRHFRRFGFQPVAHDLKRTIWDTYYLFELQYAPRQNPTTAPAGSNTFAEISIALQPSIDDGL